MRYWPSTVLAIGTAAVLWIPQKPSDEWTIVVAGDLDGYLSPCGCTKPMSGGIRRMASAVRQLGSEGRTAFLVNGGLIAAGTRQDEIKAETLAECFQAMGVSAANLGPADARFGVGSVLSIQRLSGNRFVSASLEDSPTVPVPATLRVGPFLVGGVTSRADALARPLNERARPLSEAVQSLLDTAQAEDAVPVLMLQGTLEEAKKIAENRPAIRLIVFRSAGDPPQQPVRVGDTVLVTPGEFAKHVVRLHWKDGRLVDYASVNLSEDIQDDPDVARLYKSYLLRVDEEGLLDRLPRTKTAPFAGSARCSSCHAKAYRVWKASGHARALKSLELKGHSRDPDCVGCHVTALDSTVGFRSRKATPKLANVGCESCHGPAAVHVVNPRLIKPAKIRRGSCAKCHDSGHSPGFLFHRYWPRVAHK